MVGLAHGVLVLITYGQKHGQIHRGLETGGPDPGNYKVSLDLLVQTHSRSLGPIDSRRRLVLPSV